MKQLPISWRIPDHSVWLEIGVGIGCGCLLWLLQSQAHLGPVGVITSLATWQSQVLQARFVWQSQLRQGATSFFSSESESSSSADQSVLAQMQVQVDQLKSENDLLRSSVGLLTNSTTDNSQFRVPILSVGQRLVEFPQGEQPKPQQLVFSSQELLGWIDQINGQKAQVKLLKDDTNLRLAATTVEGASGLLVNTRGTLTLTEVPTTLPLREGEVVVTLNQLSVPGGIPLGKITQVNTDQSGIVQEAVVQPAFAFGEETVVRVRK